MKHAMRRRSRRPFAATRSVIGWVPDVALAVNAPRRVKCVVGRDRAVEPDVFLRDERRFG